MGKASRIKQQSAREKIAAQREAARKAERRNRMLITGGSTLVVLVIVLAFIVIKLTQGSTASSGNTSTVGTLLPASVASQVTRVPPATLNTVGKGAVPSTTSTPFGPGSGTALTSGGKPEMLYIGAEFCPYCAAMRWSMAVALSRFGTLTALHGIHSSPHGHRPEHRDADVLQVRLHQQLPEIRGGGERDHQPRAAAGNHDGAAGAIWAKYEPDPTPAATRSSTSATSDHAHGPIYNPRCWRARPGARSPPR